MEQKRENQPSAQQVKPTDAPATKPRGDKTLTDEDANKVVGGFNPQPDPPANHRGGGI